MNEYLYIIGKYFIPYTQQKYSQGYYFVVAQMTGTVPSLHPAYIISWRNGGLRFDPAYIYIYGTPPPQKSTFFMGKGGTIYIYIYFDVLEI